MLKLLFVRFLIFFIYLLAICVANLTNLFDYGYVLYSIVSVLILDIMYVFVYEKSQNSMKVVLSSLLLYGLYDISFSFILGTHMLAWCLSNIFILKARFASGNNIKFYHFWIFSLIFFLIVCLVNYFVNHIFYWQILTSQSILSLASSFLIVYFFNKSDDMKDYYGVE